MKNRSTRLKVLLRTGRGGALTDFAIVIALIVLVAITAISGIGLAVRDTFITLDNDVGAAS